MKRFNVFMKAVAVLAVLFLGLAFSSAMATEPLPPETPPEVVEVVIVLPTGFNLQVNEYTNQASHVTLHDFSSSGSSDAIIGSDQFVFGNASVIDGQCASGCLFDWGSDWQINHATAQTATFELFNADIAGGFDVSHTVSGNLKATTITLDLSN